MSVIGFDIGNVNCVIAAAKRGGIDVLLNDEAKRELPAVVSFGDKQRFLGSAGTAFATANPKSTISQIKRLIGRKYKEPSVQEELKLLPFVTSEGPHGGIMIELKYLNIEWKLTPVEILGMLFTHLKQIAEKNLESAVVDCVIGIPSYFTDLQRREYLDAATIAGLRPLRLMHDGTAIALGYGMYKTDLLDSGPTNVVFVDIGHCDTQVTVAAFEQGKMDILSHSFDQNLGGRDFDEVLFKHFAAQFLEQYKIDVYSNDRASIRLRASCEKLKKVLSANTEAPLSIECLIEDTDVRGIITRDEFEKLSSELLERVTAPCRKALKDSGLCVDEIYTIELVGSGSRIPAITKSLNSYFKKEPTRTLNASECVARGCALRCAMLSPTLQVREYEVKDIFPYSIALPFDQLENEEHRELMLFPKGSLFPNTRLITHDGRTSLYFQVLYTNMKDLPAGVSPLVGYFKIGEHETSASEKVKIEIVVMLNDHGIFEIKSATVLIEERPSHMNDFWNFRKMVTFNRRILNIENLDVATTKDELKDAQGREQMFAEQDKKVEQTKDQRNTLESFVYDTRSKLKSAYKRFVTDLENEWITSRLQETEDWLYEDSDDERDGQIYTGKLEDLKKLLEPIENQYKDENKAQAKKPLLVMIEEYRSIADSLQPRNKKELIKACKKVEQHLEAHSSKSFDQIGWSNFIKEAMDAFKRMCEEAIRYKPSIPKHVEPVHNIIKDENKAQATKPLLAMIEENRLVADSLPLENKKKLINACTEAEHYLSGFSPEKYDQISWSKFIKKTMAKFESHCEEAIEYKPSSAEHPETVELDRSCNSVDSQTENPVDGKHTGNSMDGHQKGKPLERNQTGKPVVRNQTGKPVKPDQTSKPVKPDQTSKPEKPDQASKIVDGNQMGKPVKKDQTSKPVKPDQTSKSEKPDQASKIVDGNQMGKPVKQDQTSKPVKPDQSSKPVKPDQTSEFVTPDKASISVKTDQTSKPVNMGQTDKPFASEQMDISDPMQIDG